MTATHPSSNRRPTTSSDRHPVTSGGRRRRKSDQRHSRLAPSACWLLAYPAPSHPATVVRPCPIPASTSLDPAPKRRSTPNPPDSATSHDEDMTPIRSTSNTHDPSTPVSAIATIFEPPPTPNWKPWIPMRTKLGAPDLNICL
ncbi:unnamed protein product [Cuscuta epithymum]|uniref:Uncharacterized protein n=1 Tax=Cuscuta epithymum TaxID=186058 RepID=A0AAV0ETI6_9ASTE|nr:unnamed protein product [Cuscuta epithymum]CAH9129626.1 unnamed protein product [Cuscuta epithymum]